MAEKGQKDRKTDQSQTQDTTDEMTLEQIFSRLEEITKKMENPETGLEDAFALYKEGDTLLKEAEKRISLVDKQVRALEDDGISSKLDEAAS